ncbi:MAG: hypothetical protein Q8S73_12610 [Deltaproteobacteria bacterium]|nr:hypothetical protein [Myxococcales bacterium]MDP3214941.1 hypothetical protein [Deltaproteobacteria bacterium]
MPTPARLSDLNPDALGVDAVDRILRRIGRLGVPLSPGVVIDPHGGLRPDRQAGESMFLHVDVRASGLALTIADLCRYAQSGDTADWGADAGAEDALLTVGEALWSRPIDEDSGWTVDDLRAALAEDDEPADPLRLAVGCAVARWVASQGGALTTGEVAALASLTHDAVRQAVKREQLAAPVEQVGSVRRAMVAADDARRWLGARGVPGWRPRGPEQQLEYIAPRR